MRGRVWAGAAATALYLAACTGSGARRVEGGAAAAAESVTVPLPPSGAIVQARPRWTATLDGARDPRGGRWSAYAPASLAEAGGRVAVVDEANHEIALLDAETGRLSALIGGLGQRDGDLYAPGDAAALGRAVFVADRNNHRVIEVEPAGALLTPLSLPGPPLRLAASPDERLYALILLRDRGVRLLRLTGCCVSPAVDTLAFRPPLRRLPRAMAVLADSRIVLASQTGDLELYDADGSLTRVVHFVSRPGGAPVARDDSLVPTQVVHASEGDGGTRLLLSFGHAVGCFDLSDNSLGALWSPARDAGGRLPAVALVGRGDRGTYTYQPAGSVAALYPGTC